VYQDLIQIFSLKLERLATAANSRDCLNQPAELGMYEQINYIACVTMQLLGLMACMQVGKQLSEFK